MKAREDATKVVGQPLAHESAWLHVRGQASYTDDLPEPAGTLHAAIGCSPLAHGRLLGVDLERLRAQPGVVAVLSAADVPGTNDCGAIVHDEPILADGTLHYLGQPVFLVVARTRELARRAAALAPQVIRAEPLQPLLDARSAHALQRYVVPPMHLARGDAAAAIAAAPRRLSGRFSLGGQEQFYLEGQISLALPQEDATLQLLCSTQHPSEMQHAVARALGWSMHQVQVSCRRMGGGFGGKESQSAVFACLAALAAVRLGCAVKLRPDRDDDFMITGRRHGFEFDWELGYDDAGRVLGLRAELIANAGWSADLSAPVMTRALGHFDNAYWLPQLSLHGYCARTNTQSNTAFRGFGGPQGAFAIEHILDDVARSLGLDPLAVRRANFYGRGERDTTPYGQKVEHNLIEDLVTRLAQQACWAERRAAVAAFNAASPVLRKGIALIPVKFGISFNLAHLNQAGALVHVYTDGSVLVNHGGTEMGQGLHTKVAQVVAQELGVPLAAVRCSATDTHKVANTSATAASTGSDLNGRAAQAAARTIRERLDAFVAARPQHAGATWPALVQAAYAARVQLWSDGFYATPGLHWDAAALQGRPFHYYAFGAAVAEVVVDTLSGEHRVLRVDVLHDVGRSLNPALDIGQIEGGFVQGQGWLTSEELVWQAQTGRLLTHAPSTYKIPTARDCAPDLRVELYGADNAADSIHRSKAVGEPPILLPFSVFLAIRDAIASVGPAGWLPPLRAPATPEAVLDALDTLGALAAHEAGDASGALDAPPAPKPQR